MKTGTLKELNVRPGDVVECVESVRERTVDPHHDLSVFPTYYDTSASIFHIISRATDTPKLWRDMTDKEKGALLLAHHEGRVIERLYKDGWGEVCFHFWHDDSAYRVKPEPVRSKVEMFGSKKLKGFGLTAGVSTAYCITFETVDGKPDFSTIKMEEFKNDTNQSNTD